MPLYSSPNITSQASIVSLKKEHTRTCTCVPRSPGAAQVATWLPPVHEGGGGPAGRPHLPRQIWGEQAGAVSPAPHAQGAPALRHCQDHVHTGNIHQTKKNYFDSVTTTS